MVFAFVKDLTSDDVGLREKLVGREHNNERIQTIFKITNGRFGWMIKSEKKGGTKNDALA